MAGDEQHSGHKHMPDGFSATRAVAEYLPAIVTLGALVYGLGWLAIQQARASMGIFGLGVAREQAVAAGTLFCALVMWIVYPVGAFLSYRKDKARAAMGWLLPLGLAVASPIILQEDQGARVLVLLQFYRYMLPYFLALFIVVGVFLFLANKFFKDDSEPLKRALDAAEAEQIRVNEEVARLESQLSDLQINGDSGDFIEVERINEMLREVKNLQHDLGVDLSAMRKETRSYYDFMMTGYRSMRITGHHEILFVAGSLLLSGPMLGAFSVQALPGLGPAVGGLVHKPIKLSLREPTQLVEGLLVAQDDSRVIVRVKNIDGVDEQLDIPRSRVTTLSSTITDGFHP